MLSTTGRQLHVEVWKLRREQGSCNCFPTSGATGPGHNRIGPGYGTCWRTCCRLFRPRRVGLLARKQRSSWHSFSVCLQPRPVGQVGLTACARSTRHCETSAFCALPFRPTGVFAQSSAVQLPDRRSTWDCGTRRRADMEGSRSRAIPPPAVDRLCRLARHLNRISSTCLQPHSHNPCCRPWVRILLSPSARKAIAGSSCWRLRCWPPWVW